MDSSNKLKCLSMHVQVSQKGLIGITLVANWYLPFSNTKADQKATERAIDFMFGW